MFSAGQQIGLYTLIHKLGRGGFGEVWLAERKSKFVTTKVAIKLPLDEQVDHEAIKQEATLWEQASGHPNVLPIIDADEYDGQIVIVSEYALDGSLADKLKSAGKLSVAQTIETTIGILNGLSFLHSKGIIHRDIKPQNILLQGDTPRLADFGISRLLETTVVSSAIIGTDAYMAPESFEGKRNVQTDIWSVGIVLYQLLQGNLPFAQEHPSERMFAILTKDFSPLPDDISQSLKNVIAKGLAKQPQERYKQASEMREDLQRVLRGEAISDFVQSDLQQNFPTEQVTQIRKSESISANDFQDENETVVRYTPITKSSNSNVENLLKIASIAEESGNYQEAYNYFTKVLEIEPNNYLAHLGRSLAVGHLSSEDNFRYKELIKGIEYAIENCPEDKEDELKKRIARKINEIISDNYPSGIGDDIIKCLELAHNYNPADSAIILSLINKIKGRIAHEKESLNWTREHIKDEERLRFRNSVNILDKSLNRHKKNLNDYQLLLDKYVSKLEELNPEKALPFVNARKQNNIKKLTGGNLVATSSVLVMDKSIDELVNTEIREENKQKFKIAVFIGVAICAFAFILFYSFGNNRAGNGTDERLKEVRAKSQQITHNQNCKKFSLSEKECKELEDKATSGKGEFKIKSGDDFIKEINNECKERMYSEKKCEGFKESLIENFKRDINGEEMIIDDQYRPLK